MPRIFLPLEQRPQTVHITGDKYHYLQTVLRCSVGDNIVILDGKGASYKALIKSINKKEILVEVIEALQENTESPLDIILLQGLLKGDKMDLVIQKTTELGVKEIIPVITERSQVRETRKIARWRKIAEDASRQSGRSIIPLVHEPVELSLALSMRETSRRVETLKQGAGKVRGFVFWEEKGLSLREAGLNVSSSETLPFTDSPIHILIGPEGGFTEEEVKMAESKGFIVTSLGKRILRTETAAIAATALIQFLFGDLQDPQ